MGRLRWIGVALVSLLGALAAVLLFRKHRDIAKVKDRIVVEKARREVASLQKRRDVLVEHGVADQKKLDDLSARIVESKRTAVEKRAEVTNLSPEEVSKAFADLGL